MNCFLENDIQQVVDFPTATSGILDLVFATPSLDLISCSKTSQSLNTLSNHDGVKCKFEVKDFQYNYLSTSQTFVHSYCKADFEAMTRNILDYPFIGICWSNEDVLLEQWYEWIILIIKEYTPRRTKERCSLTPWVKPRTSNIIKRLNTAQRKQPSISNKICELQATCKKFLAEDSTDYETKLADNRCTDELFKYFCTFKPTTIPVTVLLKSEVASDSISRSSLFPKHFASIFNESTVFRPVETLESCLDDFDTSEDRISSICESIDYRKATVPDQIPVIIFKNCSKTLSKSISQIFYKEQSAVFPSVWKYSIVSPLHKKGSK